MEQKHHFKTDNFMKLWGKYPKRVNIDMAYEYYKKDIKNQNDYDNISQAMARYLLYVKENNVEIRYLLQGCDWFGSWRDWLYYETNYEEWFSDIFKEFGETELVKSIIIFFQYYRIANIDKAMTAIVGLYIKQLLEYDNKWVISRLSDITKTWIKKDNYAKYPSIADILEPMETYRDIKKRGDIENAWRTFTRDVTGFSTECPKPLSLFNLKMIRTLGIDRVANRDEKSEVWIKKEFEELYDDLITKDNLQLSLGSDIIKKITGGTNADNLRLLE